MLRATRCELRAASCEQVPFQTKEISLISNQICGSPCLCVSVVNIRDFENSDGIVSLRFIKEKEVFMTSTEYSWKPSVGIA